MAAAPTADQAMEQAGLIFNENAVHQYCEGFVEALKSTSMAGALRKYKTLLGDLIRIGGGGHCSRSVHCGAQH